MPRELTDGQYRVREKQKIKFSPEGEAFDIEDLTDHLGNVGFTGSGREFEKSQPLLLGPQATGRNTEDEDGDGPTVLSVRLTEERITVQAHDVVGVVTLLPGVKIEIEPKIGWGGLIDMLLTVLDADYADQPFGVPTGDEEERSVDPTDVIVLLAINYHRGIQTIRRQGLMRDIIVERKNSYEGTGTIDLGQTIRNHAKGEPVPNWIQSRPEYGNTVNSLLHFTGKQLLYFLKEEVPEDRIAEKRIADVFTRIHQDIRYLEQHGIKSRYRDLDEYARISIHSLPRQRRYYRRALYVAQSLLTSSLFGRGEDGPQRPLIDYVLKMDDFFEDYSQRLIEQELDRIRQYDHIGLLDDVECRSQEPIRPFSDVHHRPDHLLTDDEQTIAVLDSKYYQKEDSPIKDSSSRSRMFTYAYLQDAHHLSFLCPLAKPWRGTVSQTGDEVHVVAPKSDEFDHQAYRQAIGDDVRDALRTQYPELELFELISTEGVQLCRGRSAEESFDSLFDTATESPFSFADIDWFIDETLSGLVRNTTLFKSDLVNHGSWLETRLRSTLTREDEEEHPVYPQHETTCVPLYQPPSKTNGDDDGLGKLILFLIQPSDEAAEPTKVSKEVISVR